mmetsp:Transcript_76479/g.151328  ORF Transcript_76479/g.151328 Transcript_76479/m.151328 type:complete len:110 (+) Transcript_76479:777-1106(+)
MMPGSVQHVADRQPTVNTKKKKVTRGNKKWTCVQKYGSARPKYNPQGINMQHQAHMFAGEATVQNGKFRSGLRSKVSIHCPPESLHLVLPSRSERQSRKHSAKVHSCPG